MATEIKTVRFCNRIDTSDNWNNTGVTLLKGEIGIVSDKNLILVGNGKDTGKVLLNSNNIIHMGIAAPYNAGAVKSTTLSTIQNDAKYSNEMGYDATNNNIRTLPSNTIPIDLVQGYDLQSKCYIIDKLKVTSLIANQDSIGETISTTSNYITVHKNAEKAFTSSSDWSGIYSEKAYIYTKDTGVKADVNARLGYTGKGLLAFTTEEGASSSGIFIRRPSLAEASYNLGLTYNPNNNYATVESIVFPTIVFNGTKIRPITNNIKDEFASYTITSNAKLNIITTINKDDDNNDVFGIIPFDQEINETTNAVSYNLKIKDILPTFKVNQSADLVQYDETTNEYNFTLDKTQEVFAENLNNLKTDVYGVGDTPNSFKPYDSKDSIQTRVTSIENALINIGPKPDPDDPDAPTPDYATAIEQLRAEIAALKLYIRQIVGDDYIEATTDAEDASIVNIAHKGSSPTVANPSTLYVIGGRSYDFITDIKCDNKGHVVSYTKQGVVFEV